MLATHVGSVNKKSSDSSQSKSQLMEKTGGLSDEEPVALMGAGIANPPAELKGGFQSNLRISIAKRASFPKSLLKDAAESVHIEQKRKPRESRPPRTRDAAAPKDAPAAASTSISVGPACANSLRVSKAPKPSFFADSCARSTRRSYASAASFKISSVIFWVKSFVLLGLVHLSVGYNVGSNWRNGNAFAAVKRDGSVVVWGTHGTQSSSSGLVSIQAPAGLTNVVSISSTWNAFAAVKEDGSVGLILPNR